MYSQNGVPEGFSFTVSLTSLPTKDPRVAKEHVYRLEHHHTIKPSSEALLSTHDLPAWVQVRYSPEGWTQKPFFRDWLGGCELLENVRNCYYRSCTNIPLS